MLFFAATACPDLRVSPGPCQATTPRLDMIASVVFCNGLQPSDLTDDRCWQSVIPSSAQNWYFSFSLEKTKIPLHSIVALSSYIHETLLLSLCSRLKTSLPKIQFFLSKAGSSPMYKGCYIAFSLLPPAMTCPRWKLVCTEWVNSVFSSGSTLGRLLKNSQDEAFLKDGLTSWCTLL